MKRLMLMLIVVLVVIASGAWQSHAFDIGKGVSVDGFITAGKLWDVDISQTDEVTSANIQTNRGEVYLEGELGLKYKFVRPFVGYKYLGKVAHDEVFSLETTGLDITPFEKIPIAIRTSYNWLRIPGYFKQRTLFTGLTYSLK